MGVKYAMLFMMFFFAAIPTLANAEETHPTVTQLNVIHMALEEVLSGSGFLAQYRGCLGHITGQDGLKKAKYNEGEWSIYNGNTMQMSCIIVVRKSIDKEWAEVTKHFSTQGLDIGQKIGGGKLNIIVGAGEKSLTFEMLEKEISRIVQRGESNAGVPSQ
jgi:hypothetical protein